MCVKRVEKFLTFVFLPSKKLLEESPLLVERPRGMGERWRDRRGVRLEHGETFSTLEEGLLPREDRELGIHKFTWPVAKVLPAEVLPIEGRVLMDGERDELLGQTFNLLENIFSIIGEEDGWSGKRWGWLEQWRARGDRSRGDVGAQATGLSDGTSKSSVKNYK